MSDANIGDGRLDAGRPQADPYGAGQSAMPPPPPSIPSASPSAGVPVEETIAPADAVYTGNPAGLPTPQPPTPQFPAQQNGLAGYPAAGVQPAGYPVPGSPVAGYPAPGSPAPGYPAGGYPGGPRVPHGYPGQQVAGHPSPGQPAAYAVQGYPAPGYPAPGYPAAGYPAPGYTAPGQPYAAYGAYAAIPPSGRRFWAMQFLMYVPLIGAIAVLVIALVQRSSARHSPLPLVRENARWAANWILSFIFYLIVSYGVALIVAIMAGSTRNDPLSAVALILLLIPYAIGIYCLVTIIIGTVKADRFVHRPVLALPFFRS